LVVGVGAVVGAVVAVAGLTACSSTKNGTPEPDTVSLPSDLLTTSAAVTPTHSVAPVSSPTVVPTTSIPTVVIKPAPNTPIREVTVHSVDGTTTYDIKIWVQVQTRTCANHAHGVPIVQYLTAHPCAGLTRLLATTEVGGRPVGFAQSSLGFIGNAPTVYQTAGNFASLERANNTGSIDDLFVDGYRLPSGPSKLPSPDAFEVQAQDSGVTVVDAFYLDGATPNNAPALIKMAQDIYLQF
jgi:hypothetical protein